jgi:hypothetical protein
MTDEQQMPSDGKTSHGLLRNAFFNFFEQDFVYAFFSYITTKQLIFIVS